MEAARTLPMTAADYLVFEQSSEVRHEFVGGEVHAMGGASRAHNKIAGNIFAKLHGGLRGGPCAVYISDFKVRLEVAREDIFYYPDVVVSCNAADTEKYFTRLPTLIVEVLSPATETIDRREKKLNYLQLQTLGEYVLVAQDRREVTVFRRSTGWRPEIFTDEAAVVEFQSVKQAMTVRQIYEDVAW